MKHNMDMKTGYAAGSKTRQMALSAALTALALIFSYIEFLLPLPMPAPGMKLGLSNLVILVALYRLGARNALTVNIVRILLAGLLFGNVFSMLYSLAGGLLSFVVMCLLKQTNLFSMTGVSMAGGVAHNLGQIAVAALVVSDPRIFYYFPPLLLAGMLTGILIGILGYLICKRLPENE